MIVSLLRYSQSLGGSQAGSLIMFSQRGVPMHGRGMRHMVAAVHTVGMRSKNMSVSAGSVAVLALACSIEKGRDSLLPTQYAMLGDNGDSCHKQGQTEGRHQQQGQGL